LAGKPERNKPLGRPKHRLKNNIRMDFSRSRRRVVGQIYLPEGRGK
jgi:hypothetical protein